MTPQTPQQEAEQAWKDKYAGWEVVAITEFKSALIKKIEARIEELRNKIIESNYIGDYEISNRLDSRLEENKRLLNTILTLKP